MSVWSCADEKVYNAKNISLRKLLKELFDGEDYVLVGDSTIDNFAFRIQADGEYANKLMLKFINKLNELDLKYDITTDVRWLK